MKVRVKTFETNSSSSHSLVISKSPKRDQKIEITEKELEITPGEFGWEFETYYEPLEKARYILTDAFNNKSSFSGGLREVKKLLVALKKYLGVPVVFAKNSAEWYPYGYVDHQSSVCEGNTMGDIFDIQPDKKYKVDTERFLDFVFSSDCYFRTGNDNV